MEKDASAKKTPDDKKKLEYILDMTCQLSDMADGIAEKQLSESLKSTAELRKNYNLSETKPHEECGSGES